MSSGAQAGMESEEKKRLLKLLFCLIFPLICFAIPDSTGITSTIKLFLYITFAAILMFAVDVTSIFIVSIFLIFAYAASGLVPLSTILSSWKSDIPWITLAALLIVTIVQRTTLLQRMTYHTVIRVGGSYMGIIFAVTIISVLARIFLTGTMASVSVMMVAFGLCTALHLGKSRASAGIMLMAVTAYRDANFFVYSPDFIALLYAESSKITPIATSYPEFFMNNWVFIFEILLFALVIGKFMAPKEPIEGKAAMRKNLEALPPMTRDEKYICVILSALVVFLLTYQIHHIPMVYGFIFTAIIFYLPYVNIGTNNDIKNINYSSIFFIVACLGIGTVAQSINVASSLSVIISPWLNGVSEKIFMSIVYAIAVFANFFMTPLAEIATFGAPIAQICQSLGFNLNTMISSFFHGTQQLLFPYETAVYLVAFSMGVMKLNDFTLIMGIKMILNTLFLVTVGFAYWTFIGIL